MKRVISLLLILLLSFSGCQSTEGSPPRETVSTPPQAEVEAAEPAPTSPTHTVVLDPGHQAAADPAQEPNGPGASVQKQKVAAGTQGTYTGLAEYALNLQIALQLEQVLQQRGYRVYLTRRTHDVNISNAARASYAAQVGGEILVRIHANGSDNAAISGAMTICQTPDNPYQQQYSSSRLLSDCILQAYCTATGLTSQGVWETDSMTGINWCEIPSTIVEMGYMTNESDDTQMADPAFQEKMVLGIADGIDRYFSTIN